MKKILYVFMQVGVGGGERLACSWIKNIGARFSFEICADKVEDKSFILDVLPKKYVHNIGKNKISLLNLPTLYFLLKKGHFDIVHTNRDYFNGVILFVTFLAGVKKRISHAHLAGIGKVNWLKNIYIYLQKKLNLLFATNLLACSKDAGQWLYGKNTNFKILPNALECKDFIFDDNTRTQMRTKLNVGNSFVMGNIGRFVEEKNQTFLIDIFISFLKLNKNAILLLVGQGPTYPVLRDKVKMLSLEDKVLFIDAKINTAKLYNAMDCFVFPSLNEGFGLAALEAQTCGLPCFISDNLPKEINVCNTSKISLLSSADDWAKIIFTSTKNFIRKNCVKEIEKAGYDIKTMTKQLEDIYLK